MKNSLPYIVSGVAIAATITACGGGSNGTTTAPVVKYLTSISQVASTIAPNGDTNPYGIAIAPDNYTGINPVSGLQNVLQPGDVLVSNFSNSAGLNTGTTVMRYVPATGKVSQYYQEKVAAGPVAIAISGLGATWIANYLPGYMNATTGASSGDGNVIVLTPNGTDVPNNNGVIDNNSGATFNPASDKFAGPWGQAFAVKAGTKAPFFFTTNVSSGSIQRQKFVPGQFAMEAVTTIGRLPVGSNAFDPTGPQGMAYDATNDVLYVASTANNSIVAYPNATTVATVEDPITVFQGGALNAPLGLAINPISGSLLAVNQLDNNLVEIVTNASVPVAGRQSYNAQVISIKSLDSTPIDAVKGTGSALFGIAATKDSKGNLLVYFTNSNTNSLNVLK